jgi:hypothetical protein
MFGVVAVFEWQIYYYDASESSLSRTIEGAYVGETVVINSDKMIVANNLAKGGDVALHIADYDNFAVR